ncbi:MAG TPA: hypothetical protein VGN69_07615 [Solirubrobacteraceae bacterium]|nr:hypothetical protein [Solirubrobacteraceae bacterium]
MAQPSGSRVTPRGVRDGDPAALAAVCERRGPAVLAYCELVSAPGRAPEAASDAFGRFRAAVYETENPAELEPDALLLSFTRSAASARAPQPPAPPRRVGSRRLGRSPCELVPELLVARAENRLTPADELRLSRHLERCEVCRAAAQRFHAAERAYRDPPRGDLPPAVADAIMRALTAAAPVDGQAPRANGALPAPGASLEPPAPGPETVEPAPPDPEPVAPRPDMEGDGASGQPQWHADSGAGDTRVVPAAAWPVEPPAAAESPGAWAAEPPPDAHAAEPPPDAWAAEPPAEGTAAGSAERPAPIVIGGSPEARGETYGYPVAAVERSEAREPAPSSGLLGSLTAGGRHLPRARRAPRSTGGHERISSWSRIGLPAAIVAVALLVALAAAGVFSPGSPSRSRSASQGTPPSPVLPAAVSPASGSPSAAPKPASRRPHRHRVRRPAARRSGATAGRPAGRPTRRSGPASRPTNTTTRRSPTPARSPSSSSTQSSTPVTSRPARPTPSRPPTAHTAPGASKAPPPSSPPASGPGYQPGP